MNVKMNHVPVKGFTLLELIIIIAVIGILAVIAIPNFIQTRDDAYLATLRSDTRNLLTAQEIYRKNNDAYKVATAVEPHLMSEGVIVDAATGNAGGWSVKLTHPQLPGKACAYFVGSAEAPPMGAGVTMTKGRIVCDDSA